MRLLSAVLFAAIVACGIARAENLDNLRAALKQAPQAVLAMPVPDQLYFVDIGAALTTAQAAGEAVSPRHFQHLAAGMRPLEALRAGAPSTWENLAGLSLTELAYLAGFGRAPNETAIWGLNSAERAAALLAALEARDFTRIAGGSVLGNGEADRMNLQRRNPADPWRGRAGQASFVVARGSAVVQASRPQLLAQPPEPSTADSPIVMTALAGLEKAAGNGAIAQAIIVSPLIGAVGPNLADLLGKPPAQVREAFLAAAERRRGIPPFLGGIIADVRQDAALLVISLTFPDCTIAADAAEKIGQRWAAEMQVAAATTRALSTPGTEGLCAGVLSIRTEAAQTGQNPAYHALYGSLMRTGSTVLRIGAGE